MKTALPVKRRTPRHIVAQALVMVAIVAIMTSLVLRYWGIHKAPSFGIFCAVFNFLFFVAVLSFFRWFERKREASDSKTERSFRSIMPLVVVAFLVAAR